MKDLLEVLAFVLLCVFIGVGQKGCDTIEMWMDAKQAEIQGERASQ